MEPFYPNCFSFHCECKILDNNNREFIKMFVYNTPYELGDINILTRKLLISKYKRKLISQLNNDLSITTFQIIKCEFVMDLR